MHKSLSVDVTREMLHTRVYEINQRLETELHVFVSDDPFNNELYAQIRNSSDDVVLVPIVKGTRGTLWAAIGHVESGIALGRAPTKPNLMATGLLTKADREEINRQRRISHIVKPCWAST